MLGAEMTCLYALLYIIYGPEIKDHSLPTGQGFRLPAFDEQLNLLASAMIKAKVGMMRI
jgi:hypothetical protein